MAWHWPGTMPLSGPIMVSLLMHICVTQLQWVKNFRGLVMLICQWTGSTLIQVMACCELCAQPIHEKILEYFQLKKLSLTDYNAILFFQEIHLIIVTQNASKLFKASWWWDGNIQGKLDQYRGCWCPDSFHCQVISSHNINIVMDILAFLGNALQ